MLCGAADDDRIWCVTKCGYAAPIHLGKTQQMCRLYCMLYIARSYAVHLRICCTYIIICLGFLCKYYNIGIKNAVIAINFTVDNHVSVFKTFKCYLTSTNNRLSSLQITKVSDKAIGLFFDKSAIRWTQFQALEKKLSSIVLL